MQQVIQLTPDFTPTKKNISALAQMITETVKDGISNPLNLVVQLESVKKACEQSRELMSDDVLAELSKYGKSTTILGAKIEEKEVDVKYDYSNSPAWVEINNEIKKLTDWKKSIESVAKAIPSDGQAEWIHPETGEALSVVRCTKSSKTSFMITLGK